MSEALPPNPLPCGCRVQLYRIDVEPLAGYVVHCPLHAAAGEMTAILKMVVEIRYALAFNRAADFGAVHELLARHDVPSIQLLAKKAQDQASAILAKLEK